MAQKLPQRALGSQGLTASAQGVGIISFGMTHAYGDKTQVPTGRDSQALLQRALQLGANFMDTADVYGSGVSEEQLGVALKSQRQEFFVATKFGNRFVRGGTGSLSMRKVDGSPEYVRAAVEASLKRLGTDHIDLYYQHRIDRSLSIKETWTDLKKLVEEGKVKCLGICEATPAEIRRAHAIHPISAVQLEWSLWTRNAEAELIPLLRELGIGIVAYSPLGRGFLTGTIASPADLVEGDLRRNLPRFQTDNLEKNLELVIKLKEMAAKKGITPSQLALAWLHAQGDNVFPISGTKHVKHLEENVAAFFVKLSPEEASYLSDLFKPDAIAGDRFGQAHAQFMYESNQ